MIVKALELEARKARRVKNSAGETCLIKEMDLV